MDLQARARELTAWLSDSCIKLKSVNMLFPSADLAGEKRGRSALRRGFAAFSHPASHFFPPSPVASERGLIAVAVINLSCNNKKNLLFTH